MNNDEIQKVKEFIVLCEKMKVSKFLTETKNVRYNFSYNENQSVKTSNDGFDEDLLKSFLMEFRKTYMVGERTNFYHICNILDRISTSEETKNNIAKCRILYSQALEKTSIKINLNNDSIKPKQMIDDWFNGHYFHSDVNKKAALESLSVINKLHKMIFITTILDLVKLSIIVSNNAKNIVGVL